MFQWTLQGKILKLFSPPEEQGHAIKQDMLIKQKGFTLIEVLIYLGLFTIIIVGALTGVYQIIDSTDKTSNRIFIEQEGNFLLRKIDWALTGAKVINYPLANSSGSALSLSTSTVPGNNIEFDLYFDPDLNSNILRLKKGGGAHIYLSSDYLEISDVNFMHISFGDPINPIKQVKASFKINGQTFETTKYIR